MQIPEDRSAQIKAAIGGINIGMKDHPERAEILVELERAILELREAQGRCLGRLKILERRCKEK